MRMGNEETSWLRRDLRSLGPVAALTGLLLAGGCTLNRVDVADCETSAECRNAFGLGYVCSDDGLCDRAEPSPRCTATYPPDLFEDRLEHRDRIVFGNIVDQSVTLFQAFQNAAQLAYEQANTRGGVDGREFGVVFCSVEENPDLDDLDHFEASVASVEFLTQTVGVPGILGPVTSGEVQESFQAMDGQDVLMISPSATSPDLSDLDPAEVSNDEPGLLWRTAVSDALQGVVIARDMLTRKPPITSVAAIHEEGAYGEGLFEVFAREFRDGGGVVDEYPYADAGRLAEVTAQAGSTGVQEVLFISSDTAAIIGFLDSVATLAAYEDKGLFMTDPAANPDVLTQAAESALLKLRGTRPAPLDENEDVYASFIAAYAAEFDGGDVRALPYTPNVFDAAWLLTYGAAWALLREDGVISGTTIARGLRRLSGGEDVEIRPSSWAAVLQEFSDGNSVNVKGASGELDYDPATEETSAGIEVWQVTDRNIATLYTVSP